MMDAIYTLLIKTVHDRFHRPQSTATIANVPLAKFNERLKLSRRYQVFQLGNGIYQVQIPDSGRKYIVNLKELQCDCTNFQEYRSPCAHAIAACRWAAEDPFNYGDYQYSVECYRETYNHFLIPVSIEDLLSKDGVFPPAFKKLRGRPLTKRIRKGALKRKTLHCSNCNGTNHNIRKCRHAPALNGRTQRLRDQETSSSSSSSDLSSNQDSEIHDAALEDQVESDLYHKQVARAWEIVRRQEHEQESNNDVMEGIELGLHMNVDNIQSPRRTRSNSKKAVKRRKAVAVQEALKSPRHTRSGIVLKRIED
jgi:SWIM zinc finger